MRLPMAPQLYLGLLSRSDLCQVLSLRALPRCNPPRGSIIAQTRLAVAPLCWPVEVYRLTARDPASLSAPPPGSLPGSMGLVVSAVHLVRCFCSSYLFPCISEQNQKVVF